MTTRPRSSRPPLESREPHVATVRGTAHRPHAVQPRELAAQLGGSPLLLLLDIDGTLCEIVNDPGAARVPEPTRRTLARLTTLPDVHVALITGRAVRDARRMVGPVAVPIIGNHGLEWSDETGEAHAIAGWSAIAPTMRRVHDTLAAIIAHVPGALLEDKTYSLSVHYRDVAPADVAALRAEVTQVASGAGLRAADGKCIVNVLPPLDMDKGHAALRIARDTDALGPDASILFAGDDVTDENAFRALALQAPHAVTVRVGADDVPTHAQSRIASVAALAQALHLIAEQRTP